MLGVAPLWGHVMSMSTGTLTVEGNRARFELRMPLYEIAHVTDPQRALFDALRFSSEGVAGRLVNPSCREDSDEDAYLCSAEIQFQDPVERLRVECRLHTVTVPNHVHILRASRGEMRDQAVFDFTFTQADLRFSPPSMWEVTTRQAFTGAKRAVGGAAQWLFYLALVLAARRRSEFLAIVAAYLAGQMASALVVPLTPWNPAPRFVEAAMALTIAYMAVEILLLPEAGRRWLVAAALGTLHGLAFAMLLRDGDFSVAAVLSGALIAELLALFGLGWTAARVGTRRPVPALAAVLLAAGLAWFFYRLRA
jgi:hypothetical protein